MLLYCLHDVYGHVLSLTACRCLPQVLVEGRPGLQVVDLAVVLAAAGADGRDGSDAAGRSRNSSSSNATGTEGGTSYSGPFLVVHTLERMQAAVLVYDASGLGRWLQDRMQQGSQERSGRKRKGKPRAHQGLMQDQPDSNGGGGSTGSESDSEAGSASGREHAGQAASSRFLLPLRWSYSPGPSVSSLHLDPGCWPSRRLPYVRLSYSSLATPVTTVDLDVAGRAAHVRQVRCTEDWPTRGAASDTARHTQAC